MPYSRRTNPTLAELIARGHRRKAEIINKWQVKSLHSQIEIDYFLLFIVDKYYACESRRRWYTQDYAVSSKISHFKEAGQWPLEPVHNQHFLTMFKLAYHFPK